MRPRRLQAGWPQSQAVATLLTHESHARRSSLICRRYPASPAKPPRPPRHRRESAGLVSAPLCRPVRLELLAVAQPTLRQPGSGVAAAHRSGLVDLLETVRVGWHEVGDQPWPAGGRFQPGVRAVPVQLDWRGRRGRRSVGSTARSAVSRGRCQAMKSAACLLQQERWLFCTTTSCGGPSR